MYLDLLLEERREEGRGRVEKTSASPAAARPPASHAQPPAEKLGDRHGPPASSLDDGNGSGHCESLESMHTSFKERDREREGDIKFCTDTQRKDTSPDDGNSRTQNHPCLQSMKPDELFFTNCPAEHCIANRGHRPATH